MAKRKKKTAKEVDESVQNNLPPAPRETLTEDTLMPGILYRTGTGQVIAVHSGSNCYGRPCVVHHPSDHHMRDWPTHWRGDRGIMERICQHGVGHPDPDDISEDKVHGCDGCCVAPRKETGDE